MNQNSNRGISPIIGYILLTGIIVTVAGSLFLFGTSYITDQTAEKEDANFRIEFIDNDEIQLIYDDGSTFDSTDTDQLDIVVDHDDTTKREIMYKDGNIESIDTNEYEITTGKTLLEEEVGEEELIDYGTTVYVVWKPNGIDQYSKIVDSILLPSEDAITIPRDSGGSFDGGGTIIIE